MADASVSADGGATALQKDELVTFAIDIVPTLTITEDGNHPLIFIIQDIAALGTAHTRVLKGTANNIEKWEVYVATTVSQEELESYFIFVEGDCGVNFRRLASYSLFDLPDFTTYLTSLGDAAADPERLLAIAGEKLSQGDTMIADEEPLAAGKKKIFNETYIKVNKQNIDNLLNWISELIILQARFANAAAAIESTELKDATEELYRVTHQLRDTSLEIGLVPVETLVTKFKRLVRDLSKTLDKKVNFLSEGAETKVDKDVIELMADPMIHLIRNAIDHGIEKAADRRASGKAEHGTVKLKAFTAGSYVNITISDDGKGIHKEHVLRKAVEKGIVSKDAMLSDEEILQLIFHSGLSTAASVSDVSGRGVGMDVVKQKIQELRGDVSIKSFPGEGTSVHIRLPMSRSIIEGLLVRIGSSEYILPLTAVDKCYEVPTASLSSDHCQKVMLDGTLVPVAQVAFPALPGVHSPKTIPAGRQDGKAIPFLVPQVDADGNDRGGVRLPEVAVPLATFTGWNFRNVVTGGPEDLVSLLGSAIPLARTRTARESAGDPRPSIEERYRSAAEYQQQAKAAADRLVAERLLLAQDTGPVLERASQFWEFATK